MDRRGIPMLALVAALFAGCATQTTSTDDGVRGGRTSDGALLTLESGQGGPIWREWKAAGAQRQTPDNFEKTVRAFDYWQVDDAAVIEEVWAALFPVLDSVRARSGVDRRRKSMKLLLEAIEPGAGERPTRMDLTFLVSSSGSERFEGLACRLYRRIEERGVTPVVTVLLLRRPSGASTPSHIALWAAPGFEEPETMTALFERSGSQWRQTIVSGLTSPIGEERPSTTAGAVGQLAARVLTKSIWKRFAGDAYLESPQSGAESETPHPEGVAPALGLEVRDRRVEQVYSNTSFPPRADLDEL